MQARYYINSDGWNSPKEYTEQKTAKVRIAVIGDSFVKALNVDPEKSFAQVLENNLIEKANGNVEVYNFGCGGAHLSQYLQMTRFVGKRYKPDIVIINITHNDFLDSIYGFDNKYNDFLQFTKKEQSWIEIKPKPPGYIPSAKDQLLKRSAIARFLVHNLLIIERIQIIIERIQIVRDKLSKKNVKYQMSVNINQVLNHSEDIKSLCGHILSQIKKEAGGNIKLLLIMDAQRTAIYNGKDVRLEESYLLTKMVKGAAQHLSIPLLDMNEVFEDDYKKNKIAFNSKYDFHWNERAHYLVGTAAASFIKKNNW